MKWQRNDRGLDQCLLHGCKLEIYFGAVGYSWHQSESQRRLFRHFLSGLHISGDIPYRESHQEQDKNQEYARNIDRPEK